MKVKNVFKLLSCRNSAKKDECQVETDENLTIEDYSLFKPTEKLEISLSIASQLNAPELPPRNSVVKEARADPSLSNAFQLPPRNFVTEEARTITPRPNTLYFPRRHFVEKEPGTSNTTHFPHNNLVEEDASTPTCLSLKSVKYSLDNIEFKKPYTKVDTADENWDEERNVFCDKLKGIDRKTMVKKYLWYWGTLSAADAEYKLAEQPNESFLVRDSATGYHLFTLSFRRENSFFHRRICRRSGFWFVDDMRGYHSLGDLINSLINESENFIFCVRGERTEFRICLKFPICRLGKIYSLKQLCRDVIQEKVRNINGLDKLPLPQMLITYLKEDI